MFEEDIKQCKSFSEVARLLLGVNYYNSAVKKKICRICQETYNIDIEDIIEDNKKSIHKCLFCGKDIIGESRKIFCNSSCAASYNNKKRGKHSQSTKDKIRKTLLRHFHQNEDEINEVIKNRTRMKRNIKKYKHTCPICQKEFLGTKKQIYCSQDCAKRSPIIKEKLKEKVREKINNGTFQGWKLRNVKSFPEIFFEKVLNNNCIKFKREDFSTKKYFLDFLIEKNGKRLDLEIDGKQHQYRKEKDKERDNYLTQKGYIVYRISWNEITTEKGKKEMEKKIKDFLKFYISL